MSIRPVSNISVTATPVSNISVTESNWIAPDGPLCVPKFNFDLLDPGRSTGTSIDILVRGVENSYDQKIKTGKRNRGTGNGGQLKARYRLSDLLRAQKKDRLKSNLKRWIENGATDKGDLKEIAIKT